jgi:hypothetical protein
MAVWFQPVGHLPAVFRTSIGLGFFGRRLGFEYLGDDRVRVRVLLGDGLWSDGYGLGHPLASVSARALAMFLLESVMSIL